jgi:predicted AAA+ superfamily ATPase
MNVQRTIVDSIIELLGKYPVVALTGPRQSGKTTLLKNAFPNYKYVSLEKPDVREFATKDPNAFLKQYSEYVIIDEAQRVPSLFSYIQTIVDDSGKMGQFILSGSQNFQLMQNITQSLAGRVALFQLLPLDFQELKSENILEVDPLSALIKGFYPAIYDRNIEPSTFYYNYVQTYVQRDVSELIELKNISLFKKFLRLLASRVGQLVNYNSLANDCGVSQPTIKSWITALESSYLVFTLQPYFENIGKRLIKTPKIYFYDTGLLSYLLGIKRAEDLLTHSLKGNLFENMMIAEYVKRMYHSNLLHDIWFWRDVAGNEIDMLYLDNGKFHLFEIKSSETILNEQFKGLAYFETTHPSANFAKHLVYAGNENQDRTQARVLSWSKFGDPL